MKQIVSIVLIAGALFFSCTYSANQDTEKKSATAIAQTTHETTGPGAVIGYYLDVKNALAADNPKDAATASGELYKSLSELDKGNLDAAQKSVINKISVNTLADAQQISENPSDIKQQREQFMKLSDDITSFVKVFGASKALYVDYCPMAKANWVSEIKDIRNPYYGGEMSECGEVKETIQPK